MNASSTTNVVAMTSLSPKAPRRKKQPRKTARDKLLTKLLAAPDAESLIAGIAAANNRFGPAEAVAPPGSLLDAALRAVREYTDLPPEIGVACVHALMSAALVQSGTQVRWFDDTQKIECDLWLVVLARSGAGKTFVSRAVRDALDLELRELPEPGSARAFLDALKKLGGTAFWMRDEYGQLMRAIADGGPLGALRDYMLRSYDHGALETNTSGSGSVKVDHPVLTILGTSVAETWAQCVDVSMLADGLLARHLFVIAQDSPLSVPRFARDDMVDTMRAAVSSSLRERLNQSEMLYVIGSEAAEFYKREWTVLTKRLHDHGVADIPPAYLRRVTWSTCKYAVIYHLLLDQPGDTIGVDAMQWAWRMVELHLAYLPQVLELANPGAATKILKVLDWLQEFTHQHPGLPRARVVRACLRRFSHDFASSGDVLRILNFAVKNVDTAPNDGDRYA